MNETYTNRQLALKLAVENADSPNSYPDFVQSAADRYYRYLETGTMGR